jgi:hypothetical protein
MPLNRNNYRTAFRTAFAGITEFASLLRMGKNGKPQGTAEKWLTFWGPSTEGAEGMGEDEVVPVRRTIKFFRRPGDKMKPPRVGDQVTRNRDSTVWDVHPLSSVSRQVFGNFVYEFDVVEQQPDQG